MMCRQILENESRFLNATYHSDVPIMRFQLHEFHPKYSLLKQQTKIGQARAFTFVSCQTHFTSSLCMNETRPQGQMNFGLKISQLSGGQHGFLKRLSECLQHYAWSSNRVKRDSVRTVFYFLRCVVHVFYLTNE